MTNRQKKGIALGATGLLSLLAGIVLLATNVTPEWLTPVLSIAGVILNALGFAVIAPNTEE